MFNPTVFHHKIWVLIHSHGIKHKKDHLTYGIAKLWYTILTNHHRFYHSENPLDVFTMDSLPASRTTFEILIRYFAFRASPCSVGSCGFWLFCWSKGLDFRHDIFSTRFGTWNLAMLLAFISWHPQYLVTFCAFELPQLGGFPLIVSAKESCSRWTSCAGTSFGNRARCGPRTRSSMCGSNRINMDQVSMDQTWALHIFWGSMINGNLGKFTRIKVTLICFWMTSHNVNPCISWEIAAVAATSQDLKVPSIIALAGDDHIVRSPGTATDGLAAAIIHDRPWSGTIATEKDHLSDATEKTCRDIQEIECRPENQIPSAYLTQKIAHVYYKWPVRNK